MKPQWQRPSIFMSLSFLSMRRTRLDKTRQCVKRLRTPATDRTFGIGLAAELLGADPLQALAAVLRPKDNASTSNPMPSSESPVTIPMLAQMKREGRKSIGVVAWDYQIALIAERAGVDFVSVGDSVGVNLWGHSNPLEVTFDEILICCKAVRRGVTRALLSCDIPFGPVQEGIDGALRAAIRLVKEGGADMVKLDAAAEFPETVKALTRAGIPVFAQFGLTPQTALKYGVSYAAQNSPGAQATADMTAKLVEEAKTLEGAGAVALDFTNSGPVAGAAVVQA